MAPTKSQQESRGSSTRDRIVDAALETLKAEGFAGASARAIARTGGFNQALVFYHFGSVDQLLLAALDETGARRMEAYRTVVTEARSLPDLVRVARRIFQEDLESGHIKVLAEMLAGASARPELGPAVVERLEPWIAFAREHLARAAGDSPLAALVPVDDLAHAVVALYLGLELLTHLDRDRSRADRLFQLAESLAPMLEAFLGPPGAPR